MGSEGRRGRRLAGGGAFAALLALAAAAGCRAPIAPLASPEPLPTPLQTGDALYEQGLWPAAADDYQAYLASDPTGPGADRALFRLASLYARPDGSMANADRARSLLHQLIRSFPASPYRPAAEALLALQDEAEALRRQLEELKRIDLSHQPGG